ncbi:MAG: hypothetical protein ACJ73D_06415 [Pyrinomonadaceae bacterium]
MKYIEIECAECQRYYYSVRPCDHEKATADARVERMARDGIRFDDLIKSAFSKQELADIQKGNGKVKPIHPAVLARIPYVLSNYDSIEAPAD